MAWEAIQMRPDITRAIFSMDGYCVWDPSLVTDEHGRHHLFFCGVKPSADRHESVITAVSLNPKGGNP